MNTWNHNSSGKSRIFRALSAGALFLSAGTAASAQVLIDDFNDGDDSGWLPMANPEDLIGSWDASTGAYRLQAPGPLQPSEGLAALWGGPGVLENGHLRATVVRETENSRTSLFMRVSGETGYWFGWAPPPYGFVIARFDTFDTGVLLAAAETGFAQEVGVELPATGFAAPPGTLDAPLGDLNGDGFVNALDVAALRRGFGAGARAASAEPPLA